MDDEEFEKLLREFERKLSEWESNSGMININNIKDEDIELFEQMMRDLILPHLIGPGGKGDITNIKVMKINDNKDEDNDLTWLDKYL